MITANVGDRIHFYVDDQDCQGTVFEGIVSEVYDALEYRYLVDRIQPEHLLGPVTTLRQDEVVAVVCEAERKPRLPELE